MRIGISILTHAGQSLWENGIGQNVFHLAALLEQLPFVERVCLLDCGDQGVLAGDAPPLTARFPIVPLRDAGDDLDVAIEMQGGIDVEWLTRFRARGGRAVHHICGHPYLNLVEPTLFQANSYFAAPDRCDEVWLIPKDRIFQPMMRTLHRCPAHVVPYLWSPIFIDHVVAMDGAGLDQSFGYAPGRLSSGRGARVAIFEPNISVMKTGFIPLLACEDVERAVPGVLSKVTLYNGAQFNEHATFQHLLERLDLQRAGKLSVTTRDYLPRAMRTNGDIVVSHHNQNDANYLYLDAVHGGYALVHNSETFRDIGYYYPGFDIGAAAAAIRRACAEHDAKLPEYMAAATRCIASLSPDDRANRDAYARRLLALTGGVA